MSAKAPQYDPTDPLWLRVWKMEGIRFLGDRLPALPDAMERFQHAFELGRIYALSIKEEQS